MERKFYTLRYLSFYDFKWSLKMTWQGKIDFQTSTVFENHPKMRFLILAFFTIFWLIKINLSGNTVWPQALGFVEWDFFCNFQILWGQGLLWLTNDFARINVWTKALENHQKSLLGKRRQTLENVKRFWQFWRIVSFRIMCQKSSLVHAYVYDSRLLVAKSQRWVRIVVSLEFEK